MSVSLKFPPVLEWVQCSVWVSTEVASGMWVRPTSNLDSGLQGVLTVTTTDIMEMEWWNWNKR